MKTTIKLFLFSILVWNMSVLCVLAKIPEGQSLQESKEGKIISIVLDDSTSMVRDDRKEGNTREDYTTRWAEADYAVRALAAMMDPGDILKLYPLNGEKAIDFGIDSNMTAKEMEEEYEVFCGKLDEIEYVGATAIDVVKTAAYELSGLSDEKECHLIVITDGNFKHPKEAISGTGNDLTQEELNDEFDDIADLGFEIKYIQIGNNENHIFPQNEKIKTNEGEAEDIIHQITNLINEIYDRVAFSKDDISRVKNSWNEGTVTIDFDIPVKNITVFLQNTGENGENLQNSYCDSDKYEKIRELKIDVTEKNPAEYWNSKEECIEAWIQHLETNGIVANFKSLSGATGGISISSVPESLAENIQIYYEPAVKQRITVRQDGIEPYVVSGKDDIFMEGAVDLTLEYTDLDGEILEKQDSPFLKRESVQVEIDGEKIPEGRREGEYSGMIQKDTQSIRISNAIGIENGEVLISLQGVYEPNLELALEATDEDSQLVLDQTGKAFINIHVWDKKSGDPLSREEWEKWTDLSCKSEYFSKVKKEECIYNGNGDISIPVVLEDLDQHKLSAVGVENFKIIVQKNYSDGSREPAAGEKEVQISVTSEPHDLSAKASESEMKVFDYLIPFKKKLPVTYYCDGKELTEEQKKEVNAKVSLNDQQWSSLIKMDDNDIVLRYSFDWFKIQKDEYQVNLEFFYTKWNREDTGTLTSPLKLIPLTCTEILGVCIMLIILFALIVCTICKMIWFLYCSSRRDDYVSWKTDFELIWMNSEDKVWPRKLKWSWIQKFIFRLRRSRKRDIKLIYKIDKEIVFILYIARIDEFEKWEIKRLDQSMANRMFEIGEQKVDERNCRFETGTDSNKWLIYKNERWPDGKWYFKVK